LFLFIFMEKLFPGFVASMSIILYKTQNFVHRLEWLPLPWKFDLYMLCSMPGIVPPHFYGKTFFWALWPPPSIILYKTQNFAHRLHCRVTTAAMKIWFVQTLFHAWHCPSSFLWKNLFLGFVASSSIILYKTQNFAHRLEWVH
jgi:hypothetical protein